MTFSRLAVLFKCQHVHRSHGFKLGAHLPIGLIAGCEFVPSKRCDGCIGQQSIALDSEFVQASICHVHGIGLQLGCGGLKFATAVAGLV